MILDRRAFTKALILAGAAGATAAPAIAQNANFREGQDWRKLDKPQPTSAAANQVEVIEFFWYSCPHCNHFEPAFDAWVKRQPASVIVKRVPVNFRPDFVPQQKIYYALEAMGKVPEMHARVFKAIHVDRQKLVKDSDIFEWIGKQPGMDRQKFEDAFKSFFVATKVGQATKLMEDYQVEGVPALAIAGKYYTDGTLARSMDRALLIADSLVAASRKGA